VGPLEREPGGARARHEIPGGPVEQVAAGVADAGRLAAGQRMPRHQARLVHRGDERPLDRADVGDDRVRPRHGQRVGHGPGQRPHGRGHHDDVRVGHPALGLDGPAAQRRRDGAGIGIRARDPGPAALAGGERDGAADEAQSGDGDVQATGPARPRRPRR
jgi:hypothetical protein